MKKLFGIIILAFTLLTVVPVAAHETGEDHTHSVDSEVIEESLREQGLDQAPGVVEVPKSEMQGQKPYSGWVDEDGNPLSDEEYAKIQDEKSGMQWKNIAIALVGLTVVGGGVAALAIALNKRKK
jgi:hypothetical protein